MDIILLERVEKLGQIGDTVSVKAGFARNYLLPQGKALRKTRDNLAYFESRKAEIEADNLTQKAEAEKVAGKLDDFTVPVIRAAGENGQLYGSVTSRDIAAAITEANVTISRQQVLMERAIKTLGLKPIRLRLHPEVTVTITVNIARTLEEADQQRKLGRAVGVSEAQEAEEEAEAEEAAAAKAAAEAAAELFEDGAAPQLEAEAGAEDGAAPEAEAGAEAGAEAQPEADAESETEDAAKTDAESKPDSA